MRLMKKKYFLKFAFVASSLIVCACSPKVENRGYVKQTNWKDTIVVGKTSKQEILDKFGSPSSQSSFGDETWYYISSRKEAVGFMKPEMVEQEAASISFDASGVVSAMDVHNQNDAKDVELVKRTTPTEGHSLSFLDQTLGNLGRFNKPSADGSAATTAGHRPAGKGGF